MCFNVEQNTFNQCANITEAAATILMVHYVFDVVYPWDLANTLNSLDVCVGHVNKTLKIQPSVQRKMNILLA